MALDGIQYQGQLLRVRRPSDYNPSNVGIGGGFGMGITAPNFGGYSTAASLVATAALAGMALQQSSVTTDSSSTLSGSMGTGRVPDMDPSRLGIISTQVPDGPNKVFCGGLPYDLGEGEIKELLSVYGQLKAFHLVREKDSSQSKGFCFFEYANPGVTDDAVRGLNGIEIRGKTLTVRRAQPRGNTGGAPTNAAAGATGPTGTGLPMLALAFNQTPTRVLCMSSMVVAEELSDEKEYKEILEDVESECKSFGSVRTVLIPRPAAVPPPGLGKVYVEFDAPEMASRARVALDGRSFAQRTVRADFFDEAQFAARQLS